VFTELCEHRRENFSLDDFCEDTFNQNTRSVSKHLSDALDYNLLGNSSTPSRALKGCSRRRGVKWRRMRFTFQIP